MNHLITISVHVLLKMRFSFSVFDIREILVIQQLSQNIRLITLECITRIIVAIFQTTPIEIWVLKNFTIPEN